MLPVFNRLVVFSTTDWSYHGLPDPIECPKEMSRKSIALYYYSNGRPSHEVEEGEHSTLFKDRKGQEGETGKDHNNVGFENIVKEITPFIIYKGVKKIVK